MTIRRGQDWGEAGPVPTEAVTVTSDAEAAHIVTAARRAGEQTPPLVLVGGDLARTLGATGAGYRFSATAACRVRVDVGAALVGGRLYWFVAHLVARRSWWWGRVLVVANAAFLGRWNVAPRAHPGDGRLDVVDSRQPVRARIRARSRLRTGTHVPHPEIEQRRTASAQFDLDPALDVYGDGRFLGRAGTISIRVEPDALEVWF